ncbi:carboxylating nicotinate-nucleotide diphosphorylase [Aestuariibacter salexigens]|uniref:carboxylating nicotinate-nucleotide diphosphorylase n=1 Tax=Aestuariibacter salexigens TaxID=226010 RepID=UPI0004792AF2|nr:carboxylating nicotinate-nucleotide diphosphorylase [Aestuariibacter salexigens]
MQSVIHTNVRTALDEDLGGYPADVGDLTAQLIPADMQVSASIITREPCVVAGIAWVNETFTQVGGDVSVEWLVKDGDSVETGETLCHLRGNARQLMTAERTALNFLQTLSATATCVANYAAALEGTSTRILDTRKTLPGLRLAQKYAVKVGGGQNHRIGLFDAFLIKENHIRACGGIAQAVSAAKTLRESQVIEVEVENLEELVQALDAGADIVMLDNFSTELIRQAVALTNKRAKLEVSGNVTLEGLKALADTGVDYISSGALTKHVAAIDLSLLVEQQA